MTRIAYKLAPRRRLSTERLYRTAEEYRWPLYQPEEDYVDDYDSMRTLEVETHMGPVTLRKKGRDWALMEVDGASRGDAALMEALDQDADMFVPDFERSTNYH
jgi:hypothetical protein